jgi:signal transduction histidine kinase
LGLAIVKHLAHAHGGEATVSSAPGEGSVFTIELPRQE